MRLVGLSLTRIGRDPLVANGASQNDNAVFFCGCGIPRCRPEGAALQWDGPGRRPRLRLPVRASVEMDQLGFGDGCVLPDGTENIFGNFSIQADEGDGFGADGGFAAAECEGGDIHAVLS